MLVVSRKMNQRIVVSGPCVITVVRSGEKQVRLGFDAPPSTMIWREELMKRIEAGEPIHKIRDELDLKENQDRTTSVIPAASLSPGYRAAMDADAKTADATERQPDRTLRDTEDRPAVA